MQNILEIYLENKQWIDLTKDIVFFAGVVTFFRGSYLFFQFLKNKKYKDKSQEIDENINFREKLEPILNNYISEYGKGYRDICIRFVHWKNYPWKLAKDGYKFFLHINYLEKTPHYGWIDNTGINFEEHVWWYGNSIYIDTDGIFFIDKKNQEHKGFQEIHDVVLLLHMPFVSIVNYDFKERIEYEPVFYIKYDYSNWKKLYNDKLIIREKLNAEYKNIELYQSRMLLKFNKLNYVLLKFKLLILTTICKKRTTP